MYIYIYISNHRNIGSWSIVEVYKKLRHTIMIEIVKGFTASVEFFTGE